MHSNTVATRISVFSHSSNATFGFTSAGLYAANSLAFFVSSNFCTCASTTESSILSNKSCVSPSFAPSFKSSMLPRSFHANDSIPNISRNFLAENGKNGSNAIAKLAAICNPICKIVAVRSISVLANFQGSVSARYLLPIRAKFIASFCASRKRKLSRYASTSAFTSANSFNVSRS